MGHHLTLAVTASVSILILIAIMIMLIATHFGKAEVGLWTDWAPWGLCSKTCSNGTHRTERKCKNPFTLANVTTCPGKKVKKGVCNIEECIVEGGWSRWSAWYICSVSCGDGTKSHFRECNNPAPAHGGSDCIGESIETMECNLMECKVAPEAPTLIEKD